MARILAAVSTRIVEVTPKMTAIENRLFEKK
jgi:hypothetical protein